MVDARRDYYLGVARDAGKQAIQGAFHPDRNKAPEAEATFKRSGKKSVSSKRGNTLLQSITVCDVCHSRGERIESQGQVLATEKRSS